MLSIAPGNSFNNTSAFSLFCLDKLPQLCTVFQTTTASSCPWTMSIHTPTAVCSSPVFQTSTQY